MIGAPPPPGQFDIYLNSDLEFKYIGTNGNSQFYEFSNFMLLFHISEERPIEDVNNIITEIMPIASDIYPDLKRAPDTDGMQKGKIYPWLGVNYLYTYYYTVKDYIDCPHYDPSLTCNSINMTSKQVEQGKHIYLKVYCMINDGQYLADCDQIVSNLVIK
jgi:hypothetical protein